MKTILTEEQINNLMTERVNLALLHSKFSLCNTLVAKSNSDTPIGVLKLDTEMRSFLNDLITIKIKRIEKVLGIESKFTTK